MIGAKGRSASTVKAGLSWRASLVQPTIIALAAEASTVRRAYDRFSPEPNAPCGASHLLLGRCCDSSAAPIERAGTLAPAPSG